MFGSHVLLGALWAVYGIMHSVLASITIKNYFKKKLGPHYRHYRLAYTIFALAGFAGIIWFQLTIASTLLFEPVIITTVAGSIIGTSGLLLMLICIKKYFMGLSGLRSLLQEASHTGLIISGVHRYVRHPLYLGTFLFIWGLFIMYPSVSLLISNLVITIYTLAGIRFEEKKLLLDFGEQYRAYQKKVPALIPKF